MASEEAPKTEQEVIAQYQQLQKAINMEYNQLATLDAGASGHHHDKRHPIALRCTVISYTDICVYTQQHLQN